MHINTGYLYPRGTLDLHQLFQEQKLTAEVANRQGEIPARLAYHTPAARARSPSRVAMLSSVLKSERAIAVNIAIMRAFVRLRETMSLQKNLVTKFADLERKIAGHDESIRTLFDAIRRLMAPNRRITGSPTPRSW